MSRTTDLASKLVFEVLKVLKENDGELPSSLLMEELSKRGPLDDWAKGILEKTGNIIFAGNQFCISILLT